MTRTRLLVATLITALAGAAAWSAAPRAAACSIHFVGGVQYNERGWNDAGNWDLNRLPGADDVVCIGALAGTTPVYANHAATVKKVVAQHPVVIQNTLELTDADDPSSFADLRLEGTITGAGDVTVTGTLDWWRGNMAGSGTTTSTGHLVFDPGAHWTAHLQRHLRTEGTGEWVSGYIDATSNTRWENTGTFEARGESGRMQFGLDAPGIHNTGTIKKTTGTGETAIDWPIDNDGTLSVTTGELSLGNGTGSTGAFNASGTGRYGVHHVSGHRLELMSGAVMQSALVDGGVLAAPNGHTADLGDVELTSGALAGTGTLRVSGTLKWRRGWMSEAGLTQITAGGALVVSPDPHWETSLWDGRTLRNAGGGKWENGYVNMQDGTVWETSGTWDATGESGFVQRADGPSETPPVFRVLAGGTITRTTGNNSSDINVPVDNDGTTNVASGQLRLGGGSATHVSTGSFGGTEGGRTTFSGGTHKIGDATLAGARIDGGYVRVEEGKTWNSGGLGGNLDLFSGWLGGPGTTVVSGTLHWRRGEMVDTGKTVVPGHLIVAPDNHWTSFLRAGRTLRTEGTGDWRNGYIDAENTSVWENTGTLDLRGITGWMQRTGPDTGARPKLHNLPGGKITRTRPVGLPEDAASGSSRVDLQLENDGTTDVKTGLLEFHGGGAGVSTGTFGATGDARTSLNGGTFEIGDAQMSGVRIDGGYAKVAAGKVWSGSDLDLFHGSLGGEGTTTVGGTLHWRRGEMRDAGTTRVTGHLVIAPDNHWTSFLRAGRKLRTEGTGDWRNGYIDSENTSVWENTGAIDLRSVTGWLQRVGPDTGDRPRMHNLAGGTITRTRPVGIPEDADPGASRVDMAFENDGTTDIKSGRLEFHGGGSGVSTGSFGATGNARTDLMGGAFEVGDAAFAGVRISGAEITVAEGKTWQGTDMDLHGGGIGGPGAVKVTGTLGWGRGAMRGTGTTTVTGALVIAPGAHWSSFLTAGRKLRTEGTGEWINGYIEAQDGAVWTNTGTFQANGESGWLYFSDVAGDGPRPKLVNTGTFKKTAGTGETRIDASLDHDGGTIAQETGQLTFHGGGRIAAAAAGGTLAGGEFTLADGVTLTGARIAGARLTAPSGASATLSGLTFAHGAVGGAGVVTLAGTSRWTGGIFDGSGPLELGKTGILEVEGYSPTLDRDLASRGTIKLLGGTVSIGEKKTVHNAGTLELSGDSPQLTGYWWGTTRPQLVNTGVIKRLGNSTGTAWLPRTENDGTISVPKGILQFSHLLQTTDGRIAITIGGPAAGTQYGRVTASEARLSGTFAVTLDEGYTPADGTAFGVFDSSGVNGAFASVTGLSVPGGGQLTAAQDSGGLTLTADMPATREPAPEETPVATAEPAAPATDEAAPATAPPAGPVAVDDVFRLGTKALPLLANDTGAEGARVELVSAPRAAVVRVTKAGLRVKLRKGARARVLRLRYRLVAADGTRSGAATVTVRIARRR